MVPFAEADGGLGGSAVDIAIVMEEFGKGLVVEPFLACAVLAGTLIASEGSEEQKSGLLQPLMEGELQLALAFAEPNSRYEVANIATRAERKGDHYLVNGHKAVVLNGDKADKLVVAARTSGGQADRDGITLLIVDADTAGIERHAYQTVDGQGAAEIRFNDVKVPLENLLGAEGEAHEPLARALDTAALAICAEAVGAMESALAITLEYTKARKQFGVPIATFQALQHRMAEMFIQTEQARSIVLMACLAMDSGGADAARAVSAAKMRVGAAAKLVGEEAVQLHGGIGVTEEYSIGHFLKRLTAIRFSFGSTDFHKQRFVELNGSHT